jgi:phosphate transport system protein
MADHIVSSYDQELKGIRTKIAEMGGLAEGLVSDAVTSLTRMDVTLAQKVVLTDARLDRLQHEVEDRTIQVIARRQPMALDLREIMGALRISNDLERVGDMAKNIAKRVTVLNGSNIVAKQLVIGVEHLAEIALEQLKDVLDAFTLRDQAAALRVRDRDDEIDALYTSLFRELLTYMMEDPRNITFCTHLLFCAKNIERIGDHATNIAETVHFVVTGTQLSDERQRSDTSSLVGLDMPE